GQDPGGEGLGLRHTSQVTAGEAQKLRESRTAKGALLSQGRSRPLSPGPCVLSVHTPASCSEATRAIMPRPSKRRRRCLSDEEWSQGQARGLRGAQVPEAVEEETSSSSSTCSSSFPSSSSSSCYPLLSNTSEEEVVSAPGTPSPSHSSSGVCPTTASEASALENPDQEMSAADQDEEGPSTSGLAMQAAGSASGEPADDEKVADLVQFLLLKYRTQEPTSWAEMVREVLGGDEEHFPEIFIHACECLQLVFGLDPKEVDRQDHSYVLVNTLGLSCDGLLCGGQNVPKTGILVLILSIIFIEGNSAPEEEIWGALEVM
ncbi:Melanoma-associated antigen 10, partial [Galemys pyrenaicus]